MTKKANISLVKIMTEPKVILASVLAGFLVGYVWKSIGAAVAPYGMIYISLLAMCILPMMITAIISGLGHILRSPETRKSFKKMILLYSLGLLLPGLAAIVVAMIGRPGVGLDIKDLAVLGEMVLGSGQPSRDPVTSVSLLAFVGKIVPHNVFAALSEGRIISIVFVSILSGLALGLIHSDKADQALHLTRVTYETFELIFTWVLYLLPIGLFCLIAGLMSKVNPILLRALSTYMLAFGIGLIFLLFFYHCLLWRLAGGGFLRPLQALQEPLILTFVTNSSIIAIPTCLEAIQEHLGVDQKVTELIVPFGIIANRHGVIFLFTYTTVFLMQLYEVHFNFNLLSVAYLGTVFTGMAAEGHGAAIAPLLTDVLKEISVPMVLAPLVLTVTFPIVGRLENLLTIYATSILAVWVGRPLGPQLEKTGALSGKPVAEADDSLPDEGSVPEKLSPPGQKSG